MRTTSSTQLPLCIHTYTHVYIRVHTIYICIIYAHGSKDDLLTSSTVHICIHAYTQNRYIYKTHTRNEDYLLDSTIGWLRLVGSLTLQVSFAKEPYKRDCVLQKRPIILSSLLIIATPYLLDSATTVKVCVCVCMCVCVCIYG